MATWTRVKGQVCHTVLSWKKVCQNFVPVTFMLTKHAQQECGIVGFFTDKASASHFFCAFRMIKLTIITHGNRLRYSRL